jgi:hypothetical protein
VPLATRKGIDLVRVDQSEILLMAPPMPGDERPHQVAHRIQLFGHRGCEHFDHDVLLTRRAETMLM